MSPSGYETSRVDLFPRAVSFPGGRAHLLDRYRSDQEWSLCGIRDTRWLDARSEELCQRCLRSSESYPTKEEFFAYHSCTDCGKATWFSGDASYSVRQSIWNRAYPNYRHGEGVGSSRPCLSCLEKRIGRKLVGRDFLIEPELPSSAP